MVNGPFRSVEIKDTPDILMQLREELQQPWNAEITKAAMEGNNFEECLGIIAFKLNIPLDGNYYIPKLCEKLLKELRKKRLTFH